MAEKVCTIDIAYPLLGVELHAGERVHVDTLPEGVRDSLLRTGRLIDPEEYSQPPSEPEQPDEPTDWKEARVADSGLPGAAIRALAMQQLATVQDILDYGKAHGSLSGIYGISPNFESAIQDWIAGLSNQEKEQTNDG